MQRRTHRWTLALALFVGLAAIGCGAADQAAEAPPAEEPPAPAPSGIDRSALADPGRPEDEVAQDEDRNALGVYEFFGA